MPARKAMCTMRPRSRRAHTKPFAVRGFGHSASVLVHSLGPPRNISASRSRGALDSSVPSLPDNVCMVSVRK